MLFTLISLTSWPARSFMRLNLLNMLALVLLLGAAQPAVSQIPDTFSNLQVLPDDISRDSLVGIMRTFSFALNVRCQYCHVGGDGISFEGVEFDKDDDPDKRNARFMMRLVENLNTHVFPLTPEREDPHVTVECKTCHRGTARPFLLKQELLYVTREAGVDSAAAHYRKLREDFAMSGTYDFGEWETNQVAEILAKEGMVEEAIGIYQLNGEYHPESSAITNSIGRLYERQGNLDEAIVYYEKTLKLQPKNERVKIQLESLIEKRDAN